MQQKVVDKYFDFHKGSWSSDDKALNKTRFSFKGHLGINSTDQVGKREAKLIAGFIYGDLGFRLPSYEQSLTYANGKGIYLTFILTVAVTSWNIIHYSLSSWNRNLQLLFQY